MLELETMIAAKRPAGEVETELGGWVAAQRSLMLLGAEALPSEAHLVRRMEEKASSTREMLEAEKSFLGEIDLGAVLQMKRGGPAPRWFLYPPLAAIDAILWSDAPRVTLQYVRANKVVEKEALGYKNACAGLGAFRTTPIILPSRVREKIRLLRDRKLPLRILFEPRVVEHTEWDPERPRKPDPALLVQAGGRWFVADVWEDPAIEDPRALNALKEFYVSPRLPDWAAAALEARP